MPSLRYMPEKWQPQTRVIFASESTCRDLSSSKPAEMVVLRAGRKPERSYDRYYSLIGWHILQSVTCSLFLLLLSMVTSIPFVVNFKSSSMLSDTAWTRFPRSTWRPKNITHYSEQQNRGDMSFITAKQGLTKAAPLTAHRQTFQSNLRTSLFSSCGDQTKVGSNTCRHS